MSGLRRALHLLENHFLMIHERFVSLQGEGGRTGLPFYFIRLAGCDLRCRWCDTKESWKGGEKISLRTLLEEIPEFPRNILFTGGEPLLQKKELLHVFMALGSFQATRKLYLETGGHHSLAEIPPNVHINMDIKLSGSGEFDHDFQQNFSYLKPDDEIKFVVSGRSDFEEAVQLIDEHDLSDRFQVFLSPVQGQVELKELAEWILENRLNVRLQSQLHKTIWGPDCKGV